MNIRVKELQSMGFAKLLCCFPADFCSKLREYVLVSYENRISESVLVKYIVNNSGKCEWMDAFMSSVDSLWMLEPTQDSLEVLTRHFRSKWSTLWSSFKRECFMPMPSFGGLGNLGLLVARGDYANEDLYRFYSLMTHWYLISGVNDKSYIDSLVKVLVLTDNEKFAELVEGGGLVNAGLHSIDNIFHMDIV